MRTTDCVHLNIALSRPTSAVIYLIIFLSIFIQFTKESIRELRNFNFQWAKTLYQISFNNIAFFYTFFRGYRYNLLSEITPMTISHGSRRK